VTGVTTVLVVWPGFVPRSRGAVAFAVGDGAVGRRHRGDIEREQRFARGLVETAALRPGKAVRVAFPDGCGQRAGTLGTQTVAAVPDARLRIQRDLLVEEQRRELWSAAHLELREDRLHVVADGVP
jgi:hypothetical protein